MIDEIKLPILGRSDSGCYWENEKSVDYANKIIAILTGDAND